MTGNTPLTNLLSSCRTMYLLGYIPKDDRLYLGDKELNIVSYSLLVSVLEYQTAVMRRDFGMADKVLPTIPKEQRTRVAHFLEKQVRNFDINANLVTTNLCNCPWHYFGCNLWDQEILGCLCFSLPCVHSGIQTAGSGCIHRPRTQV